MIKCISPKCFSECVSRPEQSKRAKDEVKRPKGLERDVGLKSGPDFYNTII